MGSLAFDKETQQWREWGVKPPLHFRLEEVRRRALADGFHSGFIMGTQVASAFFLIVGVIILGT